MAYEATPPAEEMAALRPPPAVEATLEAPEVTVLRTVRFLSWEK